MSGSKVQGHMYAEMELLGEYGCDRWMTSTWNSKINETITNDKNNFLKSIQRNYGDDPSAYDNAYTHTAKCNQSLLHGLKRALQISPDESIIMVSTFGSMRDYNDTQLLSDVYTLLEKKKSQVYFLWYPWYCTANSSVLNVFNAISSFSYGEVINMEYSDMFKIVTSLQLLLSKPLNSSERILNINANVTDKYTKVFNVTSSLKHLLIIGDESFTLNFTDPNGLGKPGTCLNSDCHPNATCSEFGGYGECTCKPGFVGDGISCNDINECQSYYTNNCNYYGYGYCVNTIGSYTCNCSNGFVYKEDFGCVDIDECADSSLNDCSPLAVCTNQYYGSYTCTCPYGYYGDGKHCEVNECQQGTPCGSNKDCFKYNGSYSCVDPCYNHTVLNDPWRSTSNTYNYNSWYYWYHCDYGLSGWYRFKGESVQKIPEHCVPQYSCGTNNPIWMNGSHPAVSDGIVNRTACSNYYDGCCTNPFSISVKMCPEGFYVYKLQSTPGCDYAYCTESNYSCSGVDCAPDEECRIVDGIHGCYCKNSSYITNGIQPGNLVDDITPQVTCGLGNIEVRFSKCQLENLGYNTSSINMNYCRGVTERSNKSYITLVTWPTNGACGGYTQYVINFQCSYPFNMEISLLNPIRNNYTDVTVINVTGTQNFTIVMGLFKDSSYTTQYTDSEVWLDSSSMLYVGAIVIGATSSSQFVLVVKNCYATSTFDGSYGMIYDIITDRCPNRNDPTISVLENGVSLKSRFSLKFPGGFNQVYIHCQVGLCDTYSYSCYSWCPSMRSSLDGITVRDMTIGPIKQKANVSSDGGAAVPTAKLFISAILFLLLLDDQHYKFQDDQHLELNDDEHLELHSAVIHVSGTSNFTITMGLFRDSSYTTLYTESVVWLDSSSMVYVGVIVSGATSLSQFLLVMNNCYATPTADNTYSPRYEIIKDQCPNKIDPTISVLENSVSLKDIAVPSPSLLISVIAFLLMLYKQISGSS
ncbi:uromodulin-like [Pyxicephalus adspersus]|uniref:uromodulin-like n=1 Tax=Pyxicephalus adspersus TaxID=30357 RepID=UPI003B5A0688